MKNKTLILIITLTIISGIILAVILMNLKPTPKNQNNLELTTNKCPSDNAQGVTMTIKDGTLTNKSATVIIEDLSGNEKNFFGIDFGICKKSGADWYYIKPKSDMIWQTRDYHIDENHLLELKQSFGFWGELPPGEYKLVKAVMTLEEKDVYYFSTNFTIK